MAKKLAHKQTKVLLTEAEIRDQKLSKGEFTTNWQGRLYVSDPEKSFIAKKVGISSKGEYAIKVR